MIRSTIKGRGAQVNTKNKFLKEELSAEYIEGIDEELIPEKPLTETFNDHSKNIVNRVDSPDLGHMYSMNIYQGCEHGCVYCYARNTHEFWGFSAGLDFESKIMVKKNAPSQLEKFILSSRWRATPIMLSGNTDCYQPLEKKLELTRKCLEIFQKYRHPVGLITKNGLIERDMDILEDLAKDGLVHIYFSITTFNESLRRKWEPRTSPTEKKFEIMNEFSSRGIPVGVMVAPVIPGLNEHEIPAIIKRAAEMGAQAANYIVVRLNGSVESIFKDWLLRNYPDRYHKVIKKIESMHDGKVNDSRFFKRMVGEGVLASNIHDLFKMAKKKYMNGRTFPPFNLNLFRKGGNYQLF